MIQEYNRQKEQSFAAERNKSIEKKTKYRQYLERQIQERVISKSNTANYKRDNCKTSFGPEEDEDRIHKEREYAKMVNQTYVTGISKQLQEKEKLKTKLLIQKIKDSAYISELVNKEEEAQLESRQQKTSRMYTNEQDEI